MAAMLVDKCVLNLDFVFSEHSPPTMAKNVLTFNEGDTSRIIEMAWEDRTPFDAIERLYGLNESAVIDLMRAQMKPSSFRMWRKRVVNRATKHVALREPGVKRAYCPTQYKH